MPSKSPSKGLSKNHSVLDLPERMDCVAPTNMNKQSSILTPLDSQNECPTEPRNKRASPEVKEYSEASKATEPDQGR
jgi:hypothetical protein